MHLYPVLDSTSTRCHRSSVVPCLTSFSQHDPLQVHPCGCQGNNSLCWLSPIPWYRLTTSSSPGICPGSFCSLATACGAKVNYRLPVSFQIMSFLGLQVRGGVARSCDSSGFAFSRLTSLSSMVAVAHFHFSKRGRRVLIHACPPFPAFLMCRLIGDGHCDCYKELPCSSDLQL